MFSRIVPLLGSYLGQMGSMVICCTAMGIVCAIPQLIRQIIGR